MQEPVQELTVAPLWRVPLLWSLHIAYGFIIAGFAALAAGLPSSTALHLLAVGGVGFMILAMISRVSLGHSGRPLEPPRGFTLACVAMILAVLCRALANLLPWFDSDQVREQDLREPVR